jgi:hypothetical protein
MNPPFGYDPLDMRIPLNYQAQCFAEADEFEKAAELLAKVASSGASPSRFVIAFVINSAHSLELYLKCLHSVDGRPRLGGHRLWNLFDHLSAGTQAKVTAALFPASTDPEKAKRAVREHLICSDNAFIEWRYQYEPPQAGSPADIAGNGSKNLNMIYSGHQFIRPVKTVIKEASPDLAARLSKRGL